LGLEQIGRRRIVEVGLVVAAGGCLRVDFLEELGPIVEGVAEQGAELGAGDKGIVAGSV